MQNRAIGSLALIFPLITTLVLPSTSLKAQQNMSGIDKASAKPAPQAASAPTAVPALVPYSGFGAGADGKPITGDVPVTFLIYKDEEGGEPLFTESQVAAFDAVGHYEVQLGATLSRGIPIDLFGTGEARWLEIQISGAKVAPRVLLVSVPYALKAGDASTLGGLPASAYALAGSALAQPVASITSSGVSPDTVTNVTTTGATSGYLPVFNGTSTIVDSSIFQSSTGVGIGDTPNSSYRFDVNGKSILRGTTSLPNNGNATTSAGNVSFPLGLNASVYNSSSKADVSPVFYWEAEPTGNNTTSPGATINLLYNSNNGTGSETGLYFNPNGTVHFATGQTFPGTGAGTITGVTAGTGLTGGGTSGTVTLGINTGVVPQLAGNNSFTGSNTFVPSLYEDLDINIDNKNANSGGISPGVRLGSASGEGMASKRTSGGNQYGVDLYTNYSSRLAINSTGQVAIGTADVFNGAQLYVTSSTGDGADLYGGGQSGDGLQATGANTVNSYAPGYGGYFYGGNGDESSGISGAAGMVALGGTGGMSGQGAGGDGVIGFGGSSNTGNGGAGGAFDGADSNSGLGGIGLYAEGGVGNDGTAYAADFLGEIDINGTTHTDVAALTMDHPLDPANKSLTLTSIGSSEMVNIYSGNVTTDEQGFATVQLPDWFAAVNGDLRYQLTAIGHKAQAWVSEEVKDGKFQVASDMANVKISWQITGVRQDAYAKAHPLVVEQDKNARERGFYRHPELYGQTAQKQTEWGKNPAMMQLLHPAAAKTRKTHSAAK